MRTGWMCCGWWGGEPIGALEPPAAAQVQSFRRREGAQAFWSRVAHEQQLHGNLAATGYFARTATRLPDKLALVHQQYRYTCRELFQVIAGVSRHLREQLNVTSASKVALLMDNSDLYEIWYLAILAMGGVAVPLNCKLTPREIGFIYRQPHGLSAGTGHRRDTRDRQLQDRSHVRADRAAQSHVRVRGTVHVAADGPITRKTAARPALGGVRGIRSGAHAGPQAAVGAGHVPRRRAGAWNGADRVLRNDGDLAKSAILREGRLGRNQHRRNGHPHRRRCGQGTGGQRHRRTGRARAQRHVALSGVRHLAKFKLPVGIRHFDALPQTATGKTQ